jgi:hypothetical protein
MPIVFNACIGTPAELPCPAVLTPGTYEIVIRGASLDSMTTIERRCARERRDRCTESAVGYVEPPQPGR